MVAQQHTQEQFNEFMKSTREVQKNEYLSSRPFISPYTFLAEFCNKGLLETHDTIFATAYLGVFNELEDYKLDISNAEDNEFIYCNTHMAEHLYEALNKRKSKRSGKVFVIFGRSVREVHSQYIEAFIGEGLVHHIFAQNATVVHPRLTSIPLGIQNKHNTYINNPKADPLLLDKYVQNSPDFNDRELGIYASFNMETNPKERKDCMKACLKNPNAFIGPGNLIKLKSQEDHYKMLLQSKYVACPAGAGIDTHRFWESQYLGCIAIAKNNVTFEPFRSQSSLLLDEWSHLASINTSNSKENISPKENKILWFDYWYNLLKSIAKSYY